MMRINNVLLNNAKRAGFISKIEVVSQQAVANTDYQIKAEDIISRQGNGEDLTFFQKNQILNHWLESYASYKSDAWAKLPKLPITKSQIVNVLSGNPSLSNGDNTFLFFDDFADGDYTNNPTWTVQAGTWNASAFNLLTATQADRITALTSQAYGRWVWDFKFDSDDGAEVGNSFLLQFIHDVTTAPISNGNGYGIYINNNPNDIQFYLRRTLDGTGAIIGGVQTWVQGTDWHTVEVTRDANDEFKVYLDDVLKITVTDDNIVESTYINIDNYRANAVGGDKRVDNFRFCKYASPEPLIIKRKISGKAGIIKAVCGGISS